MQIQADLIVVSNRQRTEADVDELFVQSVVKRLIHPIVLRRENGNEAPILVVGERRLLALKKGGITDLIEGTHFRFFDDLDAHEARVVELEENVKRSDLPWRDHVTAIASLHKLYCEADPKWTPAQTAKEINFESESRRINYILMVHKNLNAPMLRDAGSIKQAISILENAAERRLASIIGDISQAGNNIFNNEAPRKVENADKDPLDTGGSGDISPVDNDSPSGVPSPILVKPAPKPLLPAVLNVDFSDWIKAYSGPKFTLIHCDFPYDLEYKKYAESKTSTDADYEGVGTDYWTLLDVLCDNIEKIASYQSHVMFWFSMKYYQRTKDRLSKCGLSVHDHPLFWHKTDNAGIIPGSDGTWPRRIYETAFLCSRGKRPLVKALANTYGAPTASNPVHPSQKPEPVLHHFFGMFVDETTDVLDPTCGSGTSLRAAEFMGARSVLGLELDMKYAETAESLTQTARKLRGIVR